MELLELLHAIRRRWILFAQAIILFPIVAVVAAFLLPKNYIAASRVMVSSSDSTLSILSDLGLGEVAAGLNTSTDDIQTTISLATTRPLLNEVIWRLQLRDPDGRLYTFEELLVPGLTGELEAKPNLSIVQQQGTDILIFEARAGHPELARLISETAVEVAIQKSQARARADTRSARLFIEDQLKVVQSEFDLAMQNIAEAQATEEILDLDSELRAGISRMSELMLSLETNAAAIQELRGKISELRAYQGRERVDRLSAATVAINAKIQSLQTRQLELNTQRAEALAIKTAQHPDVLTLDDLIAENQQALEAALDEQHEMDPNLQQLESQLQGLVRKGAEIQASIDRMTTSFSTYPDKMRRISQLQLAGSAAETVYQSLQEQRYQIGVAEAMLVSDLQLIDPARAPDRHDSPKVLVNAILGLLLGVVTGLALVLGFEYIDDSIKRPDDLRKIWNAPLLGIIQRYKEHNDTRVISALPKTHPIVESYRSVRNALSFASVDTNLKMIAVSSAVPSEGKSTFSINLAVSFAREGKKVLVVDMDLRRPSQHRTFPNISNHIGITDVLTGKIELHGAIQHSPIENLSMLTSGRTPPDPGRLVESLKLRQMLIELQKSFDLLVLDTPPSLVVNDAIVLARQVDAMILVVEAGQTSRKLVEDLHQLYDASGVEVTGLILNKFDYIGAGYGAYYKAYQRYLPESSEGSNDAGVA